MNRNLYFDRLLQIVRDITWVSGGSPQGFVTTSRRLRSFADVPEQPAAFVSSGDELFAQTTGLPYSVTLEAKLVIYHRVGTDETAIPDEETSLIMDAVQAALNPPDVDERQTLGGLVHHCWIDGTVLKDSGDLDGQAVIVVPIKMLVP